MERGFTLLEVMIGVALSLVLAGAGTLVSPATQPYVLRASVREVSGLLDSARALAAMSGDGATIAVAPENGGFTARLFAGRPDGRGTLAGIPSATVRSAATAALGNSAGPFGLFVAGSGSVAAAAPWEPSQTLSSEPPCTQALAFVFGDGWRTETHAIPCERAAFDPPAP